MVEGTGEETPYTRNALRQVALRNGTSLADRKDIPSTSPSRKIREVTVTGADGLPVKITYHNAFVDPHTPANKYSKHVVDHLIDSECQT